jgi:NADH-quinone oxidoreductase subunit J
MTTRLLRSVIGLALVSVIITIIMFQLNSPLAAVFELSVCAGLIFAIFVTTISFTYRINSEKLIERRIERISKFWMLPILSVVVGLIMYFYFMPIDFNLVTTTNGLDVRNILWNFRHIDLFGQIIILLAGSLGVAVLFKEIKE